MEKNEKLQQFVEEVKRYRELILSYLTICSDEEVNEVASTARYYNNQGNLNCIELFTLSIRGVIEETLKNSDVNIKLLSQKNFLINFNNDYSCLKKELDSFYDQLTEEEKNLAAEALNRYTSLCNNSYDYIKKTANEKEKNVAEKRDFLEIDYIDFLIQYNRTKELNLIYNSSDITIEQKREFFRKIVFSSIELKNLRLIGIEKIFTKEELKTMLEEKLEERYRHPIFVSRELDYFISNKLVDFNELINIEEGKTISMICEIFANDTTGTWQYIYKKYSFLLNTEILENTNQAIIEIIYKDLYSLKCFLNLEEFKLTEITYQMIIKNLKEVVRQDKDNKHFEEICLLLQEKAQHIKVTPATFGALDKKFVKEQYQTYENIVETSNKRKEMICNLLETLIKIKENERPSFIPLLENELRTLGLYLPSLNSLRSNREELDEIKEIEPTLKTKIEYDENYDLLLEKQYQSMLNNPVLEDIMDENLNLKYEIWKLFLDEKISSGIKHKLLNKIPQNMIFLIFNASAKDILIYLYPEKTENEIFLEIMLLGQEDLAENYIKCSNSNDQEKYRKLIDEI